MSQTLLKLYRRLKCKTRLSALNFRQASGNKHTAAGRVQAALKSWEGNELFRAIFFRAGIGMAVVDLEGRPIESNEALQNMLGYSKDELAGMVFTAFTHPDDVRRSMELARELSTGRRNGYQIDNRYIRKDGHIIWCHLTLSLIRTPNGQLQFIIAMLEDITERKRMESELREKEMHFRALLDMLPEAVFEADENMNLIFANRQAFNMFGYNQQDFENGLNGFDMVVPEDRAKALEGARNRILGKRIGVSEYRALRNDGSTFPALFSLTPIISHGVHVGFRGIIMDISSRKQLEMHLQQAQKMESIGNLASGIAHDFNNILSPIIGLSEMLLKDSTPGTLKHKCAGRIFTAGIRGRDLVKQILALSRQSAEQTAPVRIQKILEEVLKLVRSTIPANIEIHHEIQPDCGLIAADPTRVHQVAMNLITNAFHAVESNGGRIFISLKEVEIENSTESPLEPGRYVELTVSDTGCGIDPAIIGKIFDPYFTTKPKGKGTGLGLAVAYGIVKELRGEIRVHSRLGEATSFNVQLPVMNNFTETLPSDDGKICPTGMESILVVDDEESIAEVLHLMLEQLGYRVTSRIDSSDALRVFKTNPAAYDMVISDLTMPHLTGDQLARELVAIRPDLPIIICTGYSERLDARKAEAMGIKGFMIKPIIMSDLATKVRAILDAGKIC